ncbi:MAG: YaiI/YqxD family protein [Acutalibacteraceae bacterium]|nr:YaiI/YqxD family protein [Acutalibacteraceae bacterium]
MKIFIDADGCPVVDITVRIAKAKSIGCYIICDTAHEFHKDGAETVVVEKGADSVDFKLVNLVSAGDIVVTQDYGLAAMCLARKAIPLSQNGLVFTDKNIDELLFSRYVSKKIRNAGGRLKGPSKRTTEQDEKFEKALEFLIMQ